MTQKLNCVLLVDDDKTTNTLNEMVIDMSGCAEKVVTVRNGLEALNFLKSEDDGKHPQPDLIFLDINMPGMNGWEFLEEYKKLEDKYKGNVIVVMLTTSLNPDDEEKASDSRSLNDFMNKPLTRKGFNALLEKNFPEVFNEISQK